MKVFTLIFSVVSWCTLSSAQAKQTVIPSYLPNTFTAITPHTFAASPQLAFDFSSEPTAFTVPGYTSQPKVFEFYKKPYVRPKVYTALSPKYTGLTTDYEITNIKSYDQYHHAPAHYMFQYNVHDPQHGSQFGHAETRQGDVTKGQYVVLLPDGRRQIVDYIADNNGYRPTIRYEGGHDKIGYRR